VSEAEDRLSAGTQVHVGRQPARTYRDELRRVRAVELDEFTALRALERVLLGAAPVQREAELEAWIATDDEHRLSILARVVRWQTHAMVLAVGVHDAETLSIRGAGWTAAALQQFAASTRLGSARAPAELTVAIAWAVPVDVSVTPERWRYRGGVDRLDVSLVVQRVDRAGTPLVVAAEGSRR
jgi:hypothetical protein